jgi:hypothetical protein
MYVQNFVFPFLLEWRTGYHIWIGRAGLLEGIVSLCMGYGSSWSKHCDIERELGFEICVRIGRVFQFLSQVLGFYFVKKSQLYRQEILELEAEQEKVGVTASQEENKVTELSKSGAGYQQLNLLKQRCGNAIQ